MAESPYYVPVLLDKRAELHALAASADELPSLRPLIQMRQPEPPQRPTRRWSPEDALQKRVFDPNDGLIGCWGYEKPLLVDSHQLDGLESDTGQRLVQRLFEWCDQAGLMAVPVTDRRRDRDSRALVAQSARRLGNGAAIRLQGSDLGSGLNGIRQLLHELDLPRAAVDLIMDLGDLPPDNSFLVARVASEALKSFAPVSAWRAVTIAGTSFPDALHEVVEYNSHAVLPRVEQDVWQRAVQGCGGTPSYGDYGIVSAGIQPGFRGAANIRYSLKDRWLVLRGQRPEKAPPDDYAQLARDLVELPHFRDPQHCPGCTFIAERAHGEGNGNATQWRQAGFTHHFAVVAEGLR